MLEKSKKEIEEEQIKKMDTIRNLTMRREGMIRDQEQLSKQNQKLIADNERLKKDCAALTLSTEAKESEYSDTIAEL